MVDFNKLPMKSKLDVYYTSCKASEDFSNLIIELLKGILKPNKKETILMEIYRAIHCWIKTVTTLNNSIHFQAVASAARSVFEHVLDMRLISDNKIENAIEKFEAFGEIEKFRMAKKFADFAKKGKPIRITGHEKKIEVASNQKVQQRIESLKLLWEKKQINVGHWSGLKTEERTNKAGISYEMLYNTSFIRLSWYVHPGLVGIRGFKKETLELVYGDSMRLIHEMFIDAILILARELKLNKAIPNFDDLLKELKLMPGFVILEENKKYLESLKTNIS